VSPGAAPVRGQGRRLTAAETAETVVVGGGQAGLAVSHHLRQLGREHLLLERGQIGETWRCERWDSFLLNTPNFFLQLPGHEYAGDDRLGFLTRDETVAHLEQYAHAIDGDVRTGVEVRSLSAQPDGSFKLETSAGPLKAKNVVVAAGSFRRPTEPPGGVLVVGSGQSGCQIAAELHRSGWDVVLSLGRCPSIPLEYGGRTAFDLIVDIGMMDETVDALPCPAARLACNPTVDSENVAHLVGRGSWRAKA
jgi:putative flavoprotein involved in K+ transport